MIEDRIEREILIEAPPDVVWRTITDPEQIIAWLSEAAEVDARPGCTGELVWEPGGKAAVELEEAVTVGLRVQNVERPHYFSFRWMYPPGAAPDAGNSLLVEFSLNPEGESTRLRLVETGFSGFRGPEGEAERTLEDHRAGWDNHLGRLRAYLASEPTERASE